LPQTEKIESANHFQSPTISHGSMDKRGEVPRFSDEGIFSLLRILQKQDQRQ